MLEVLLPGGPQLVHSLKKSLCLRSALAQVTPPFTGGPSPGLSGLGSKAISLPLLLGATLKGISVSELPVCPLWLS